MEKTLKPSLSEGKVRQIAERLRLNKDWRTSVPDEQTRDKFPEDVLHNLLRLRLLHGRHPREECGWLPDGEGD